MDNTEIIRAQNFENSFVEASKSITDLGTQLANFIEFKKINPSQRYNAKDSMFRGAGPLGQLRIWHCHFTQNYSLLYRIKGSNPRKLYLFGMYTHMDLGISNTPNNKRQQQVSKTFGNEFPELKEEYEL
jgi:hypothetical protein